MAVLAYLSLPVLYSLRPGAGGFELPERTR